MQINYLSKINSNSIFKYDMSSFAPMSWGANVQKTLLESDFLTN
jgi:hypothetical protein